MLKNQKGITLIALVITIIVLLILAGVTIAMLTGSDSAPVKANEAKQKQDIGAAKDQVYIMASKYQADAYERVYVDGKGAASSSSTLQVGSDKKSKDIGSTVGNSIYNYFKGTKNTSANKVGNAEIYVKYTSGTSATNSCDIIIKTTDYYINGHIAMKSGTLSWDDEISKGAATTTDYE